MIEFTAVPLEKFSSLHTLSLLSLLGIKSKHPFFNYSVIVDFNLQTPPQQNTQAKMTFHLRDFDSSPHVKPDFCITNVNRWRLDISHHSSFVGYLQKMKRKHYTRFDETQKTFANYGAKISVIEEDWSQYAEEVYKLYLNVAERHGKQLYDLNYFRMIAKQSQFKLICAGFEDHLIGALVIVDEQPILHSMCCGLDYNHSKNSHAYAYMHYEFIRLAIESKKFSIADVGITANDAKSMLDFQPVSACMDVIAHRWHLRALLRMVSFFVSATINPQARLALSFGIKKQHLKHRENAKGSQS